MYSLARIGLLAASIAISIMAEGRKAGKQVISAGLNSVGPFTKTR